MKMRILQGISQIVIANLDYTPAWSPPVGGYLLYFKNGVLKKKTSDNVESNVSSGGGSGTVESVALTAPAQFNVSGSPITEAGTLAVTWANQVANAIMAGPNTGSPAAPTFRALVSDDVPLLGAEKVSSGTFDTARIPTLDASKIGTGTLGSDRIPNLDAAKVTTGVFGTDRIPDLSALKITSGVLDAARVPDLDAAKITTGSFDAARIPNLDSAKIATGVLDTARIPSLGASKITSETFDAARIPDLAASKIASGVFDNARINFASPSNIGSTAPADGTFGALAANTSLKAPAAAGGAAISQNGHLTVDTTSNALKFYSTSARVVMPIHHETYTLKSPATTENQAIFYTDKAITVTKIVAHVVGSSTPSRTINVRHNTNRTVTTDLLAANQAITNTTVGQTFTSLQNTSVVANSFIWLAVTAGSGTVTSLSVTVYYTYNP